MGNAAASCRMQYQMTGIEGEPPVLVETAMNGVILDALSEVTVTQKYRNDESKVIEAVYTFPLPLDAILLDLNIRFGEKEYQGQVMPCGKAEKSYEKAIKDGSTAIMLENPQPGIYTMNIGNLLPGEECVVTYRYGMFHFWQGETLRISLPTVIAPRYGDPVAGNLQPHQIPVTDIMTEHSLSLAFKVKGAIINAAITSPSHRVKLTKEPECVMIELVDSVKMDRDFILEIKAHDGLPMRGYYAQDGMRILTWVPFHPLFSQAGERKPLAVTIVVDCSGSMQGDSIAQAREALLRIVDSLHPMDSFGLVMFGSSHQCYANRLLPADSDNLEDLRRHIVGLDANMGGTELGSALKAAYQLKSRPNTSAAVLLITDGQVNNWKEIATVAQKSGQRVFTVGVGSAVTEAAVRGIAEKSGGVCELVSPREDMAGRIYRHFLRMQSTRGQYATVNWSKRAKEQWPSSIERLYSGDTLHQCAWFDAEPTPEARLSVVLPEGGAYEQKAEIVELPDDIVNGTLSRLVAGYRLRGDISAKQGEKLATEYGLISAWTNYFAMIKREGDQVVDGLPALRQVKQMWPAGGHGVGSVLGISAVCNDHLFLRKAEQSCHLLMPSSPSSSTAGKIIRKIGKFISADNEPAAQITTTVWSILRQDTFQVEQFLMVMPSDIREELHRLSRQGLTREDVVIIFLVRLLGHLNTIHFSRQLARVARDRYSHIQVPYEFDRDRFESSINKLVQLFLSKNPIN